MLQEIPDILSRIVAGKQASLGATLEHREALERAAAGRLSDRGFLVKLSADSPAIIAEIKKKSPSKGLLSASFDPPSIARSYEAGGAAALSVLTDETYFGGTLADLEAARAAVSLPVLRKDFTVHEIHVIEAAAHGADAILLIAAVLSQQEMRQFRELAAGFGMAAIIEVHRREELGPALDSGAEIVGVNNRNLHTFEVTLETSLRLAELIPESVTKVSESGLHGPEDLHLLADAGFQAFLVGEHLMKSGDPAGALQALRS